MRFPYVSYTGISECETGPTPGPQASSGLESAVGGDWLETSLFTLHLCSLSDSQVELLFFILPDLDPLVMAAKSKEKAGKSKQCPGRGVLTSSLTVSVCPTWNVDPVTLSPPPLLFSLYHPLLLSFTSQPAEAAGSGLITQWMTFPL